MVDLCKMWKISQRGRNRKKEDGSRLYWIVHIITLFIEVDHAFW